MKKQSFLPLIGCELTLYQQGFLSQGYKKTFDVVIGQKTKTSSTQFMQDPPIFEETPLWESIRIFEHTNVFKFFVFRIFRDTYGNQTIEHMIVTKSSLGVKIFFNHIDFQQRLKHSVLNESEYIHQQLLLLSHMSEQNVTLADAKLIPYLV